MKFKSKKYLLCRLRRPSEQHIAEKSISEQEYKKKAIQKKTIAKKSCNEKKNCDALVVQQPKRVARSLVPHLTPRWELGVRKNLIFQEFAYV